jgi:hypothetical protein
MATNSKASRLALFASISAVSAIAASMPASAQFVCSSTADQTTCTNSGNVPGDFTLTEVDKSVKAENFGTVGGFVEAFTTDGNATATNSGSIGNFLEAFTTNGNAAVANSGTVDNFVEAFTTTGNAAASNSGTIGNFLEAFTTTGNAAVANSGSVGNFVEAFTTDGNATATNTGTIGNFLEAFTTTGNASVTNSGTVGNFVEAFTTTGNATATNTGTIGNFLEAFTTDGNATATNTGTVGNFLQAFTTNGDATATNFGSVGNFLQAFTTNGNATATNTGTVGDFLQAFTTNGDATARNSGSVGDFLQVFTTDGNARATNSGSVASFFQAFTTNGNATANNSGNVTGFAQAFSTNGDAWVRNSGTIGGFVQAFTDVGNAGVWNVGTINDRVSAFVTDGTAKIINAGTINNFPGTAVELSGTGINELRLLAGSRIIGGIELNGTNDTVNFRSGNHNLTFNTLAGKNVIGAIPFAVSGNWAAAVDPTSFSASNAVLNDFTRSVSQLIAVVDGAAIPPAAAGGALNYAPPASSSASSWAVDVFANMPGRDAYAADLAVFKAPKVVYAEGFAIWAKAFAGERIQEAEGVLLRNTNRYFGAALGAEKRVQPNLWLGAFIGGGTTNTHVDIALDRADSDLGFAGIYGRTAWGATFLLAGVQGGITSNSSTRVVNNNLLPNGTEIAKASYDGWYVSPEVTVGHHFALGQVLNAYHTITPSLQIRYLYASFDGFTETGTTAPLSANTRTAENLEERAELKFTRTAALSPQTLFMLNLTGGGLGIQRVGGDAFGAVLLGQPIPFAIAGKDTIWGGFVGGGFEVRHANVAGFASAEFLALSDDSTVVSGKAGVRVGF